MERLTSLSESSREGCEREVETTPSTGTWLNSRFPVTYKEYEKTKNIHAGTEIERCA